MIRFVLTSAVILSLAMPALAHRLVIYAFVEKGEVVVETKFSSGKFPATGTITASDAEGAELLTLDLDPDGETRFPVPDNHGGGLQVTVITGEGHEDYWILTEQDLTPEATK